MRLRYRLSEFRVQFFAYHSISINSLLKMVEKKRDLFKYGNWKAFKWEVVGVERGYCHRNYRL